MDRVPVKLWIGFTSGSLRSSKQIPTSCERQTQNYQQSG